MKPVFLAAVCMAMAASSAMAGLTPEALDSGGMVPATDGVSRSGAYAPNDSDHVYDMMSLTYGGPDDLQFQITQQPATGGFCNRIHLRPGATSISSIHIVIDQRIATAAWTFSIAFRNDTGPFNYPIGAFLTTQSMGLNAWYVFGGMPFGGASPTLFQFDLGAQAANVTQGAIWTCVQGNQPFRVRTGGNWILGPSTHGQPGRGTPTSLYIGSGFGIYASSYGIGIGSASLMSSFSFDGAGSNNPTNWHMALGGMPEPATISSLVLGVLVLRRRRTHQCFTHL
ncbi:MAG TPA: hypothetical protein VJZ71_18535 [Phycisphaerae bacterium]|nr:hypothetical protein [Phycisphaerae bacterium]